MKSTFSIPPYPLRMRIMRIMRTALNILNIIIIKCLRGMRMNGRGMGWMALLGRRGLALAILRRIPGWPGATISLSLFESGGHRKARVVDIIFLIRRMGHGINALYRAIYAQ